MLIEEVIQDHLNKSLPVEAFLELPDPMPSRLVVIIKTGSGESNRLASSVFAFQSYAETLYEAAKLNESVKNAVKSLVNLGSIGSVRLNSDYNFTDTELKNHRYQAVFNINHY